MKKVFFIGICGISMSALAVLLHKSGVTVSGCDKNFERPPLCLTGISVVAENELKDLKTADTVVYSSAIKENHPAMKLAKILRKKIMSRGELLGLLSQNFERVIAVAGSHGKSTTTAMIFHCLRCAGENPTLHLGAILSKEKTNVVVGDSKYLVCEACEYYDNFLHLYPYIAVVTNLEREHLDYFKTFENERRSFEKFKSQAKIVVDKLQYSAQKIRVNKYGGVEYELWKNEQKICKVRLKVGGIFNVQNSLYVFEVCERLGINMETVRLGLQTFEGIQKRLEKRIYNGKSIIVDYAHHPTEIQNSFSYLKKLPQKKRLIFQPHTYSRTRSFFCDFVKVLSAFDSVALFKTYPAREKPSDGISAFELYKSLKKLGKNVLYFASENKVKNFINKMPAEDIAVLMGAGDLPEKLGLY